MVNHIITMVTTIIYIFYLTWYLINSWKLLSEKHQTPPWKNPLPPKNSEGAIPHPFCQHCKFFRTPCRKGGRTLCFSVTWISASICFLVGLFFETPCKTTSQEKYTAAKCNIYKTRIHTSRNRYLEEEVIILKYASCFVHVVLGVKATRWYKNKYEITRHSRFQRWNYHEKQKDGTRNIKHVNFVQKNVQINFSSYKISGKFIEHILLCIFHLFSYLWDHKCLIYLFFNKT